MNAFITKHNVLCEQQYGFRANGTTLFMEEITATAVGVFVDLKYLTWLIMTYGNNYKDVELDGKHSLG